MIATVGESLGVGALAETFVVERPDGCRQVLKRMHRHCAYDPVLVAMFEHEGKLLRRFDHAAIPRWVASYRDDAGVPHLLVERVAGRALGVVLAQGPSPEAVAASWGRALFDALAYVHACPDREGVALGVVHRDVSPGNVVARDDGTVSLVDFGIATSRWRMDPERGVLKGTRGYMAPEVITGEGAIDGRADVFAAGVLLYELLTGRRLYGGTATASMMSTVEAPVPSVREHRPDVSPELDALVQRCLAKLGRERPTAAEARDALGT